MRNLFNLRINFFAVSIKNSHLNIGESGYELIYFTSNFSNEIICKHFKKGYFHVRENEKRFFRTIIKIKKIL